MTGAVSPLSVGIAVGDRVLRQYSQGALQNSASAITARLFPENGTDLVAAAHSAKPSVLVTDLLALGPDFGEIIRSLRSRPISPEVIVLHGAPDAGAILKAMRAGAREFFYEDIEHSLRDAISVIGSAAATPAASGKLYAFIAVKGGCGATTLAAYTAAALARDKSRRVLLADMHLGCPGTAFLLREAPLYKLESALLQMDRMDRSLWEAMITTTRYGFALAPVPSDDGTIEAVVSAPLDSLMNFSRTQYSDVVIDCGSGLNRLTATLAEAADEIVLVSTTDVTALHHAKRVARLMREAHGSERLRLVLNRVGKRPGLGNADFEKMLGQPVYSCVPNDYRSLAQASEQGEMLAAEHPISEAISSFVVRLTGHGPGQKKKRFHLFR